MATVSRSARRQETGGRWRAIRRKSREAGLIGMYMDVVLVQKFLPLRVAWCSIVSKHLTVCMDQLMDEDRPRAGSWYTVPQGTSVESVAYQTGHFPQTLWDAPENTALREKRLDMHILLPGDMLWVPPIRPKKEERPTDQRHRFRRRGVPSKMHIALRVGHVVLANCKYTLTLSEVTQSGTTDSDGGLEIPVIPDTRLCKLEVETEWGLQRFDLGLRQLDPIDEVSGIQGRLKNLGYYINDITGEMDVCTSHALADFQCDNGLDVTGAPDDATKAKLTEVSRC